ncbi:MAG TPA: CHAT domain-containing protein [Kofleriaceae bacterium]
MIDIRQARILMLCATLCGGRGNARADTADALVQKAAAALDGSTWVIDRRGEPGVALRLLARAESIARAAGDSPALGRALALEVRAAAAAGDYARGLRASAEAKEAPLDEARRAEVAGATQLLEWLQTAQGLTMWQYDNEVRMRLRDPELHGFAFSPTPPVAPSAIDGLELSQLLIADATLALSRTDGQQTGRLLEAFQQQVVPTCAAAARCPWEAIFLGELAQAAGHDAAAAAIFAQAAERLQQSGETVLAVIAETRAGDAWGAPLSSPLELNLLVINPVPSSLAARSGRAVPELQPVPRDRLARARECYRRARILLRTARCPRCAVDLDLRDAYLALAVGELRTAARRFAAAAESYRRLGDVVHAGFGDAAAAGASLLGADGAGASVIVRRLASELAAGEEVGVAMGAARLLGRVAFRLDHLGSDPRAAEQALDLALIVAERLGLTQVGAELAAQKAELLVRLGQRHDGLLLNRRVREAQLAYLAVVPTLGLLRKPGSVENELASMRQVVFASAYDDTAAFFSEGDLPHARETNELLRSLVRQGTSPMAIPGDKIVETNEVEFMLAEFRFDEALDKARKLGDPLLQAVAYLSAGQDAAAADLARQLTAQAIDELPAASTAGAGAGNLKLQELRSKLQRGIEVLTTAKAASDARRVLEGVEAHWKAAQPTALEWLFGDPTQPWLRDVAEAEIAEGLGELPAAESRLARAAASIARTAAALGDLHAREGFDADWSPVDRAQVRVLIKEGRAADALLSLESTRGRVYHEQLLAAGTLAQSTKGEALLRSWWRAETKERAIRFRMVAGEAVPPAELSAAEAETRSLRARIAREFPSFEQQLARHGAVEPRLLGDLRAALAGPAPTMLLAYFVTRDDVTVWVFEPDGSLVMRRLPGSTRVLREQIQALYNHLSPPQEGWEEPSHRLYDALIRPVEDLLPRVREGGPRPRLGIVPHAGLNLVPFAALLGRDGSLVERYDVFYTPSLRTYLHSVGAVAAQKVRTVEAFGFNGDLLQYAEQEAAAIAASPRVHVGPHATRAAIREAAVRAPILHLATHATQDTANPFAARIFAADGALTIDQLVGIPWKARLVTLSACETAAGKLTSADEFTGISRALLAAGAATTVITSWRIDDETTADLMKRFYARLVEGADPAAALGDAQRAILARGGDSAHPGFWAPFMLVGADR